MKCPVCNKRLGNVEICQHDASKDENLARKSFERLIFFVKEAGLELDNPIVTSELRLLLKRTAPVAHNDLNQFAITYPVQSNWSELMIRQKVLHDAGVDHNDETRALANFDAFFQTLEA